MVGKRALSFVTLSLLCFAAACSSSADETPTVATGTARSAVIKGKPSDKSQDAVVLLIHYDPNNRSAGVGSCTGTLLAPKLVLTARHCVGDTDPVAACAADGKPIQYGAVRGNHPAKTLYVFTGKDRPDFSGASKIEPAAKGFKILDNGGKNLCNQDIALIVLDSEITDMPIAPIRLESDVTKGEMITAVGWGVTDKTPQPEQRQQRTNVKITNVGPDDSDMMGVPPNEFEVGESICSGDSGGPAFAQETGAVVGVVSRGGGGRGAADENDPAANCIGGSNLYTKVAPFKDMIMKGYELAEAEPWLEGGPDPRKLKPRAACSEAEDCRSNLCLADPDEGGELTCAEDCSQTDTCTVEGQKCVAEGDAKVCRNPPPPPPPRRVASGCAATGSSSPTSFAAMAFGLCALASLRRRPKK